MMILGGPSGLANSRVFQSSTKENEEIKVKVLKMEKGTIRSRRIEVDKKSSSQPRANARSY